MNIFRETSQLIDFKGRIFVINTILLSIIFVTMNFFTAVRFNISSVENYLVNNQQIRVLLKEGTTEETIKNFEMELNTDSKIAFHAYGSKELTVKDLEKKINLNITENNSIKNHMAIFFGEVQDIKEIEGYVDSISKKEYVERVLFNKELFEKIIKTKRTFTYIRQGLLYVFIIPLYVFIFLLFRLNYVHYEEELFQKFLHKRNGFRVLLPYYLKKVIIVLLAWCISYTVFSIFYTRVETLLYILNPNVNFILFENLPKMTFAIQIIISLFLIIGASFFIQKKKVNKRWKNF